MRVFSDGACSHSRTPQPVPVGKQGGRTGAAVTPAALTSLRPTGTEAPGHRLRLEGADLTDLRAHRGPQATTTDPRTRTQDTRVPEAEETPESPSPPGRTSRARTRGRTRGPGLGGAGAGPSPPSPRSPAAAGRRRNACGNEGKRPRPQVRLLSWRPPPAPRARRAVQRGEGAAAPTAPPSRAPRCHPARPLCPRRLSTPRGPPQSGRSPPAVRRARLAASLPETDGERRSRTSTVTSESQVREPQRPRPGRGPVTPVQGDLRADPRPRRTPAPALPRRPPAPRPGSRGRGDPSPGSRRPRPHPYSLATPSRCPRRPDAHNRRRQEGLRAGPAPRGRAARAGRTWAGEGAGEATPSGPERASRNWAQAGRRRPERTAADGGPGGLSGRRRAPLTPGSRCGATGDSPDPRAPARDPALRHGSPAPRTPTAGSGRPPPPSGDPSPTPTGPALFQVTHGPAPCPTLSSKTLPRSKAPPPTSDPLPRPYTAPFPGAPLGSS